jgi:predicted RNA-binding Zn ribbon-like protein
MSQRNLHLSDLKLDDSRLCLDFANTAAWHASDQPTEQLNSYADLVAWASQNGIVTEPEARQLSQEGTKQSTEAVFILKQAIALREAIYRIFSAVAGERRPEGNDLNLLNTALGKAFSHLQVTPTEAGFTWKWTGQGALEQMLWPVARSAADLLTSAHLDRVKECEDDRGCGVLFLDTSRNRSRRWCAMRDCGNRAKVRRHRQRKRIVE